MTEQFNRYVIKNPDFLDSLPTKAVLVLLDADDPEFNRANIELAQSSKYPTDAPRVYIQLHKQIRVVQQVEWMADIIVSPVAA